MIYFKFHVLNPFHTINFKNLFCYTKSITKNKTFEFELIRNSYDLFEIEVDLRCTGMDHAGPRFAIAAFGYSLNVGLHDNRHWNYEADKWED